jgi:hypothetical protein
MLAQIGYLCVFQRAVRARLKLSKRRLAAWHIGSWYRTRQCQLKAVALLLQRSNCSALALLSGTAADTAAVQAAAARCLRVHNTALTAHAAHTMAGHMLVPVASVRILQPGTVCTVQQWPCLRGDAESDVTLLFRKPLVQRQRPATVAATAAETELVAAYWTTTNCSEQWWGHQYNGYFSNTTASSTGNASASKRGLHSTRQMRRCRIRARGLQCNCKTELTALRQRSSTLATTVTQLIQLQPAIVLTSASSKGAGKGSCISSKQSKVLVPDDAHMLLACVLRRLSGLAAVSKTPKVSALLCTL